MPKFDYDEIHESVEMYKNRFKREFAEKASAFFEELLAKSKVNEEENAELVKEIDNLQQKIDNLSFRVDSLVTIRVFLIIAIVAGAIALIYNFTQRPIDFLHAFIEILAIVLGAFGIKWVNPKIANFRQDLSDVRAKLDVKKREAWKMMQPLNRQFQWDTLNKLVDQTLSIIDIDEIFSKERLKQLYAYGMEDFGDDRSAAHCQSGSLNGNPWAVFDLKCQDWIKKTYYGYKTITYKTLETEVTDSGRTRWVWKTKTQRLKAEYQAPAPVYLNRKHLIYGHGEAPDLIFFRKPVNIANDRGRRESAIKELEKKSRDLSTGFTIASNHDFDASFYAVNRNNEHQFTLLYSAAAQKETYNLLKDETEGYGDDFSFEKRRMLNILSSEHLNETDISGDPDKLRHYDLKQVRENFLKISAEYFKCLYFSFAPLFCIPLYQTHDATKDVPTEDAGYKKPSKYEYEALANYMGNAFDPPDADTASILKIKSVTENGDSVTVLVSAKAFSEVKRRTYVSVFGRDLCFHDVPVDYYEYLPVVKDTEIKVCQTNALDSMICGAMDAATLTYRRGLAAFKAEN